MPCGLLFLEHMQVCSLGLFCPHALTSHYALTQTLFATLNPFARSRHHCNPFSPKSDQRQISPAASPRIFHHTVWRTWLFIAYLVDRWFSQILTTSLMHVSFEGLGECIFWTWEWKGFNPGSCSGSLVACRAGVLWRVITLNWMLQAFQSPDNRGSLGWVQQSDLGGREVIGNGRKGVGVGWGRRGRSISLPRPIPPRCLPFVLIPSCKMAAKNVRRVNFSTEKMLHFVQLVAV